eukprot:s1601_g20.t4
MPGFSNEGEEDRGKKKKRHLQISARRWRHVPELPPTFLDPGMTPLEPSLEIHASFVEEGAEAGDAEESLPVAGESLFSVVSKKEVEARELRKKQLEEFCETRQEVRLSQADAVDGIPDWLLDASSLLDEFYQALSRRSGGLERFRTVIAEAAKRLNDEEWEQFRRMPFDAIHRQDLHVFSRLVADAEPHWKRLMEDPARSFSNVSRQAIVREYLYIGVTSSTSGAESLEPALAFDGVAALRVKFDMEPAAEAVESVFYVSQKALLVVKMKLKNEEEIPAEVLRSFSFPGDHEEDQMLIPVDLSVLDKHFPAEEEDAQELFDQFDRLNVDLIIEKLGSKKAGEVFVEAQQAFLANRNNDDPDMRAQPMSVAEWRRLWAGCEEDLEEEVLEEDQEVNEEANEGDDVEEGLRDPSEQMMEFFQRRGWNMHRAPPVLPRPFDKQAGEADGPDGYQLAVLDLTFPCDAPQEGAKVGVSKARGDLFETDVDAADEVLEEKGFRIGSDAELSDDLVCDVLPDAEQQVTWAPGAGPAPRLSGLPPKASGFGKIGVSRSDGVRRRLHAIQGALAEALRNLQRGGVLVASWCGLPTHPVLPFLTKQLRPGFRRVHVLVPPDCVTFETYIEFDPDGHNSRPDPVPLRPRESRNSLLGLEPAEMCKFNFLNWLRSPLRSWSTGYDDVLAWTLNFRREICEECLPKYKDTVVNDVRADAAYDRPWLTNMPAKSHVARSAPLDMEARFDEMWSIYATKLALLMNKLEPHSLDPDLMPEKPPYRFNATTSWSVPRPILPPAELVTLPQRKQMQTEGVPEERFQSKGSKSAPSKSRSRSKEHSKRGRTKSKESGKKSGACQTLPNDSSTSSEKPTAGISASEISGTSSATAIAASPSVMEQGAVSEELPVDQTADEKLEPPGDATLDPGPANESLADPASQQDPEIDLFEELPQMAPPTDGDGGCPEPFDTILFVDVDGVLNVGIQDDGNAPILLKTNELDLARELCAAGYNGRDADTARRICALASHSADCFGSITYEALASQDQLSKVLLGRLALLIQEAGSRCHVVLSSSWRKKQHAGRRKVLEEELSQCLGRPFVFDGVTALLLPERHAVHRLAAIRMYLSDFAQKDRFTANVKVVVIDDFFLSPISGWDCGDTSIESVADAEAYLTSGMESSDLTAEVKILHCYEELATGGYRLQVGTGLSRNLLADAFEFLKPKDAVSPVHLQGPGEKVIVKEGAKKSSFFQVVANAFAPPTTPVLWVI